MKKIFFITIVVGLFSSCKETSEPFNTICTDVILQKVDSSAWKYCFLSDNFLLVKYNNANDTLTLKVLKHFENVKATILMDSKTEFCIQLDSAFLGKKENGTLHNFGLFAALNFPECFKKDKLRVLISGDLRALPGLSEANCGEPFELTKIKEIP